jgi:hypothetical protein
MSYNLHVVGMSLLMLAFVIYITNFKEINKYFVQYWKTALQLGREAYYQKTHPNGPYKIPKSNKNFYYKQMVKQHGRMFKDFHRRILNPNKLVRE